MLDIILNRIVDRHLKGTPIRAKNGRSPILEQSTLMDMRVEARNRDHEMNSLTIKDVKKFIDDHRRAEMKARGLNPNVSLPSISRSSIRNLRLQFAPDRFTSASIKNPTRIRALAEIQNAITCAALASQLQDVSPETFISMDAVGVRLGDRMDDIPSVYLAAGSRQSLLDCNLLPATSKT